MSYDVCIVGGAGHVGAPLAIVLATRSLRTLAYDIDAAAIETIPIGEAVRGGRSGVITPGGVGVGTAYLPSSSDGVIQAPAVILTVGMPIDEYHNPRLDIIDRTMDQLIPHLTEDHTLILRSTVFPG